MAVLESLHIELTGFFENPRSAAGPIGATTRPMAKVTYRTLEGTREWSLVETVQLEDYDRGNTSRAACQEERFAEQNEVAFVFIADNRTIVPVDEAPRRTDTLDEVYRLVEKRQHRQAMERIAGYLDDLLNEGKIPECNIVLREARVEELSEAVLVAVLGVTRAAKDKLRSRENFYQRAIRAISDRRDAEAAERVLARYR